jgi:hypothetical protein
MSAATEFIRLHTSTREKGGNYKNKLESNERAQAKHNIAPTALPLLPDTTSTQLQEQTIQKS